MGEAADVMRRKIAAFNAQDREATLAIFSPDAEKEVPGANLSGADQIVAHFREGVIVSSHLHFDQLTLFQQLGVAPAPMPA